MAAPAEPKNPTSLKELGAETLTDELRTYADGLAKDVQAERTNLATWQTYIDRYRNLRYGIRNVKTNPWPNCANFVLGLIDAHINRVKPHYVNLVNVSPIVTFEPFGPEDVEPARKRELLFDWRMRTQVKFFDQYVYGIDYLLQDGAVVFKTVWRYDTGGYVKVIDLADFSDEELRALYASDVTDDVIFGVLAQESGADLDFEENEKELVEAVKAFREGKTSFTLELLEVVRDRPQVLARNLRDDVTIPIDTLLFEDNLDDARFIDDLVWTTVNDVRRSMRGANAKYVEYPESDVKAWGGKWDEKRRYVTTTPGARSEQVLLHETVCWYDLDGDGLKERCLVTWPDASPRSVLRIMALPYDHGQVPYTLIKRELNDPMVHSSRGLPALDEDYQVGISTAFNQAVDNGTIVNTPKVVYKRGAISNARNARYIPGETVEIIAGSVQDYEVRQQVNASQTTLFQQAQYLKAWADQRVGDLTAALTAPTNLPGAGQQGQKTKAEVNLLEGMQAGPQSMDLLVFQQQMARVYYQLDALYDQFGNEEETLYITGEEPLQLKRKDIQGRFNMVPNGRLDNTNPMMRAQKAFNLMKVFAGDPDVRQYELKRLFLMDYDPRISGKVLLTKQEMAARDAQTLQEQEQQRKDMELKLAELQELKDALEVKKELALTQIQGRKYAPG